MISIIIINYNGKQFIMPLIKSLQNQSYKDFEIIVIDNNSKELLYSDYISNFESIKFINNKKNYGFSYAVNQGMKIACSENIVLLNNDIYLDKKFLENAYNHLNNNSRTFYAPLVLNYTGSLIDSAGDDINREMKPFKRMHKEEIHNEMEKATVMGFSMSACYFKKHDFNRVGGMRNKYFLYFEDVDFSIRVLANGYNVEFQPDTICYHYISAATKKLTGNDYSPLKTFYESRNRMLLLRNLKPKKLFINIPFILKGTISSIVFHFVKTGYVFDYISGIISGINTSRYV